MYSNGTHRALTDSGWRPTPSADVIAGRRYWWNGVLLELTFLVSDEQEAAAKDVADYAALTRVVDPQRRVCR